MFSRKKRAGTFEALKHADLYEHERQHARWVYEMMSGVALLHAIPKYAAAACTAGICLIRGIPADRAATFGTAILALGIFIGTWVACGLLLYPLRKRDFVRLESMLTEPAKRKRIPMIIAVLRRADPKTVRLVGEMSPKLKQLLKGGENEQG